MRKKLSSGVNGLRDVTQNRHTLLALSRRVAIVSCTTSAVTKRDFHPVDQFEHGLGRRAVGQRAFASSASFRRSHLPEKRSPGVLVNVAALAERGYVERLSFRVSPKRSHPVSDRAYRGATVVSQFEIRGVDSRSRYSTSLLCSAESRDANME